MGLSLVSSDHVNAESVEALGLDGELLDLTSTEALAGLLRRAAGFHCPCSPSRLVRSAVQALDGLHDMGVSIRESPIGGRRCD